MLSTQCHGRTLFSLNILWTTSERERMLFRGGCIVYEYYRASFNVEIVECSP